MVPTVHLGHQIRDVTSWKEAFDQDSAGRQKSGVRRYRISRPVDDPVYVMVDLDFESTSEPASFLMKMRGVWQSPQAAAALLGTPQTRIVEAVESKNYSAVATIVNAIISCCTTQKKGAWCGSV